MSFFGNLSFNRSSIKEPNPEPVPPAIECMSIKPCIGVSKLACKSNYARARTSRESLPSASRSTISITSSYNLSPAAYPCAQLFPAPPPSCETKMFSGLYKFAYGEVRMLLITCYITVKRVGNASGRNIHEAPGRRGSRVGCSARRRPGRRRRPCDHRPQSPIPRGYPLG